MKRRPPDISPEDAELFRDAIGEVRRIEPTMTVPPRSSPPPEPKRLRLDEAEALRESRQTAGPLPTDAADELSYRHPKVSERVFKQLKRGEFSIQDEIDLHHQRAADAEAILKQFLTEARRGHHPCVRIVHGKGLRSEGAPVLKMLVDRVLRHRGDVLAFASAPANQGGSGAVLVLLDRD
jgi:DNA-nicking Smr family endonuclease